MSYVTNGFDQNVIELLKNGAVGCLPSDTIYGLSAVVTNQVSIDKLHKFKDRSENKPYIILISDIEMLNKLSINPSDTELIKQYWPGALTVIFEASNTPDWLHRGTESLAVRLPANKDLQDLISLVGPIISTSANKQGQQPAKDVQEAKAYFGNELDFYVDVGELSGQPSTIIKLANGQLEIIRQGAVKINQ